jgi:TRAP-type C4-dicarboxylate transport system substrate-binding protein
MKKLIALVLSLGMILALAACGGGSTTSSDSTDSADSASTGTASAADDTVYNLTFSMHSAAESTNGLMFREIFDEIEEKTDGHVKITIYGSGTLAAAADVADMVKGGGADIGWLFTPFYYGQYPLSDVISVPLQGAETSVQGTQVLWDLYENYPEMAAEWSDYKILQMYANPVSYIYSSSPISSVSDLAGLSIRSSSGGVADCLAAWGANVITMAPNDIYDGISKNNIQGYTAEPTMITDYSLQEVTPYVTKLDLYQSPFVLVMNKDVYDSLPAEYQAVFDEYSTREASLEIAEKIDQYVEDCYNEFVESGSEVIEVSDADYAEFKSVADDWASKWASQYTTDDFDAEEYYQFAADAYAKYAE